VLQKSDLLSSFWDTQAADGSVSENSPPFRSDFVILSRFIVLGLKENDNLPIFFFISAVSYEFVLITF
jgi:hypothetical protein